MRMHELINEAGALTPDEVENLVDDLIKQFLEQNGKKETYDIEEVSDWLNGKAAFLGDNAPEIITKQLNDLHKAEPEPPAVAKAEYTMQVTDLGKKQRVGDALSVRDGVSYDATSGSLVIDTSDPNTVTYFKKIIPRLQSKGLIHISKPEEMAANNVESTPVSTPQDQEGQQNVDSNIENTGLSSEDSQYLDDIKSIIANQLKPDQIKMLRKLLRG